VDETLVLINVLTIIGSVVASTGFWTYLTQRRATSSNLTLLILGLANDRITHVATEYINRGYITPNEYKNIRVLLYEPYLALGGNGSAKKLMNDLEKLPFKEKGER
jgi:hypothetical protein